MGFAGFSLLAFVGLTHSTPIHGAIIMSLMPLITTMVIWYTKKVRPPLVTLGCVLLALIGVCLTVTKGNFSGLAGNMQTILGDCLILAGATCWVIYTLGASQVPHWSTVRYTALSAALGTVTIFLATVIATMLGYVPIPSVGTLLAIKFPLLYLITIAGVIAVFSWNTGIKKLGSMNGVLFINLVSITTFIIAIIQGYQFNNVELLGAGITITALIINNLYSRQQQATTATLKPSRSTKA